MTANKLSFTNTTTANKLSFINNTTANKLSLMNTTTANKLSLMNTTTANKLTLMNTTTDNKLSFMNTTTAIYEYHYCCQNRPVHSRTRENAISSGSMLLIVGEYMWRKGEYQHTHTHTHPHTHTHTYQHTFQTFLFVWRGNNYVDRTHTKTTIAIPLKNAGSQHINLQLWSPCRMLARSI